MLWISKLFVKVRGEIERVLSWCLCIWLTPPNVNFKHRSNNLYRCTLHICYGLQTMLYLTCNWGVINHNNSNNAYINNIIPSEQQQFCSAIEYRRTTISIYVNYVLHVCMKVCMIEAIDRVVFVRTHISFPLASVL